MLLTKYYDIFNPMKIKWKWLVVLALTALVPFRIAPLDAQEFTAYAINISSSQPTYRLYNIARFNIQIKKNNQPVSAGSFDIKATFPTEADPVNPQYLETGNLSFSARLTRPLETQTLKVEIYQKDRDSTIITFEKRMQDILVEIERLRNSDDPDKEKKIAYLENLYRVYDNYVKKLRQPLAANSKTINVVTDTEAPVITISGVTEGTTYNGAVVPVITITDASSYDADITLNGAAFTSGTQITQDGSYVLSVTARDRYYNTSGKSVSFNISTSIPDKPGWYLIWHDEFDGAAIDPAKWMVEEGDLVKNNELQYYSPEDVYLHDGLLTLRSQARTLGHNSYTSGLVETRGIFNVRYGRFEIRARLPKGQGIWPAHWMLPASRAWPPEIDIMELVGNDPYTVYGTVHWGTSSTHNWAGGQYNGPDFSEGFHTFALEWEESALRWYVDDTLYYQTSDHVPQELFYIILNTAVGGTWPGEPDETTVFPQYHDIDYVRVYGKEIEGTYFLTTYSSKGKVAVKPGLDRYNAGSAVILTAYPAIGYKFDLWSGTATSRDNPFTLTMDRHHEITANYIVDPDAPQLLSRDRPCTASSAESDLFLAPNAVDGNLTTRWSSKFSDPQWIYVDLGASYQIEAVRLKWELACAKIYAIQVSDDAQNWSNVYYTSSGQGGTEEITGLNARARYVRMYGSKRYREWGYSLWEFEVFGRP